tara:strand:- start:5734 stop:6849 length:1116 start_codon:yes stop_codon:yes gene_type:complete
MHNIKVLFIAPRFHTNQFFLTKKLLEKNIEVNFLSIYIGGSENHEYLQPIQSKPSSLIRYFLKNKNFNNGGDRKFLSSFHLTSFKQCWQLYRKLNPDIVIIRNLRSFISSQHFLINLVLRKKIYLYTQNHYCQNIGLNRRLFYSFLKFLGVKHYTPVFGDKTKPKIPNSMYIPFVIENMVEKEIVESKLKNHGIQIVTIGKMQTRKNILELIESLVRLNFFREKHNKLYIISECISNENQQYLDLIQKKIKSFSSQVIIHLNIDHSQVFTFLKKSDLFVLPSHREPAAFSILEAMACGTAVVCSNENGTHCYIKNGKNGQVFEYSKDFKDLDLVLKSILNKNVLVNFGMASLELINQNHGIEKFYSQVINR